MTPDTCQCAVSQQITFFQAKSRKVLLLHSGPILIKMILIVSRRDSQINAARKKKREQTNQASQLTLHEAWILKIKRPPGGHMHIFAVPRGLFTEVAISAAAALSWSLLEIKAGVSDAYNVTGSAKQTSVKSEEVVLSEHMGSVLLLLLNGSSALS